MSVGTYLFNGVQYTEYGVECDSEYCSRCEAVRGIELEEFPPIQSHQCCHCFTPLCVNCCHYDKEKKKITFHFLRFDGVIYIQEGEHNNRDKDILTKTTIFPLPRGYLDNQDRWVLSERLPNSIFDKYSVVDRSYNKVGTQDFMNDICVRNCVDQCKCYFRDLIAQCTCTNCGKQYTASAYMDS